MPDNATASLDMPVFGGAMLFDVMLRSSGTRRPLGVLLPVERA
jgi:hypothetical protein